MLKAWPIDSFRCGPDANSWARRRAGSAATGAAADYAAR